MGKGTLERWVASTDPAMVVVTTTAEGIPAGCLVGYHSQSSMSPEHYCVWLSKANHTYRVGLRAAYLAVHALTVDDLPLAELFGTRSGEDGDKFAGLEVETGEHGVPLLSDLPHRLVLERIAVLDDGGDHVCVTGRVVSAQGRGALPPLRLSDVMHLQAGHPSSDRSVHP